MAEPKIKHFKCIMCGEDIAQEYKVGCPHRKYCSLKCKWAYDNKMRGKRISTREKKITPRRNDYQKEYNRKYYEMNRHAEIKRAKEYNNKNKERLAELAKQRRRNNIEEQTRKKESSKRWYRKNKERFYMYQKEYKKKNPDKVFARKEINKAIDRGDIHRQPCEICGNPKTDAHHDDYNKPLEVRWLCRSCHKEWHLHHKPVRVAL